MLLFTLLLISSLTVMAGATLAPALPDLAAHFDPGGERGMWVRLVLTLPALATALAAPGAGYLLDRFGRRGPLVGFVALYALAGSAGLYLDSLTAILVSRALLGVAVAGTMTGAVVLIADFYGGADRQRVMGQQAAFMGLGGVLFLGLGGLLGELGWRGPFAVYLIAIPILGLTLATIPARGPAHDATAQKPSLSDLDSREKVRLGLLCGIALLGMLAFYIIPVQAPFRLAAFEGVTPAKTGLALATMTMCGAIGSILFRRFHARVGTSWVFSFFFALLAIGFLGLGRSQSFVQAMGSLTFIGLGTGMLMPNTNVRASREVPEALRGRVLGLVTMAFYVGQFLSPVASEPLVARYGTAGMFTALSPALLALSLVFVVDAVRRRGPRSAAS
jgi:MFS family permease